MPLIKAENIFKYYIEGIKVLDDVSIEINKGEFVSILGASGSGKSTLLAILSGLDKPSSGNVFFDDMNLVDKSEKDLAKLRRTKIGYVFQFFNLVPYMTVKENVLLPLILNGKVTKEMEGEVDELLDQLGLSDYSDRLPSKLSGGEQQRVAIARGLIFKPEVLFLDEPTGNLDSKTGHSIMELLAKINKEYNTTIVQVTHSKENAKFSSRLIYIQDGKIEGSIDESVVASSLTNEDINIKEIESSRASDDIASNLIIMNDSRQKDMKNDLNDEINAVKEEKYESPL